MFLGGRPEGCRVDWSIGLAAVTKIHKNISDLGHFLLASCVIV